jgi:hypothetical protein
MVQGGRHRGEQVALDEVDEVTHLLVVEREAAPGGEVEQERRVDGDVKANTSEARSRPTMRVLEPRVRKGRR